VRLCGLSGRESRRDRVRGQLPLIAPQRPLTSPPMPVVAPQLAPETATRSRDDSCSGGGGLLTSWLSLRQPMDVHLVDRAVGPPLLLPITMPAAVRFCNSSGGNGRARLPHHSRCITESIRPAGNEKFSGRVVRIQSMQSSQPSLLFGLPMLLPTPDDVSRPLRSPS
jgi:hypothetical protein